MPRTWFSWTDSVLLGSNRLFIVSEMTVPGPAPRQAAGRGDPRAAGRRAEAAGHRQSLRAAHVLVRPAPQPTSSRRSATPSSAAIPNDYRLVREAIDRGVPLDEVKPGNKITAQLKKLVLPQPADKAGGAKAAPLLQEVQAVLGALTEVSRTQTRTQRNKRWPAVSPLAALPRRTCRRSRSRRRRSKAWPGRCFRKPAPEPPAPAAAANPLLSDKLLDAKVRLHRRLIEEINLSALEKLPEDEIRQHVQQLVVAIRAGRAAGAQHAGARRLRLRNPRRDDRPRSARAAAQGPDASATS